jgi:hypothetical protein
MKLLEVGDVVYACGDNGMIKYAITRTTKTKASSLKLDFKRQYVDEGYVAVRGENSYSWSCTSYRVATPELDHRFVVLKGLSVLHGKLIDVANATNSMRSKADQIDVEALARLNESLDKINEEMTRLSA